MDRIQLQASKLWDLLFADETGQTYQSALNLTGTILKESAQLIWLIICSVFVFGAWFSDASVKTGNSLRTWVSDQGDSSSSNPVATDPTALADKGKNLLETGRVGVANLLSQAREELGLEPLPPEALKKKIKPVTATQPAATPAVEKAAAPTASPATISAPSAAPAVSEPAVSEPAVSEPTGSTPIATSTTASSATAATTSTSTSTVEEEAGDDADATEVEEEVTREAVDDEWPPTDEE